MKSGSHQLWEVFCSLLGALRVLEMCVSYHFISLSSVKRAEPKTWVVTCPCRWCGQGCLGFGLLHNELKDLAVQWRATYRQFLEFPTGLMS